MEYGYSFFPGKSPDTHVMYDVKRFDWAVVFSLAQIVIKPKYQTLWVWAVRLHVYPYNDTIHY